VGEVGKAITPPSLVVRRNKKDVEGVLKSLLLKRKKPHLVLIRGASSEIHTDVETALGDAAQNYRIEWWEASMLEPEELLKKLQEAAACSPDIVGLVRGGGNGLEVLSDPRLVEDAAELSVAFVVAAGHAADHPVIEAAADKAFSTPTALGTFLREQVKAVQDEENLQEALRQMRTPHEDLAAKKGARSPGPAKGTGKNPAQLPEANLGRWNRPSGCPGSVVIHALKG